MADLAEAVVALADEMAPDEPFDYAGNSIGGAVGLQLLLHAPERVLTASLLCTAAAFGSAEMWHQRAAVVRESGIEAVVSLAKQRWFAEHFLERGTNAGEAVIDALNRTDAESYALACEALAGFDVTDRLSEMVSPVLAVAGAEDVATPPRQLEQIATGVRNGRLVVLEGVAHLAPVEAPVAVAELVAGHVDSRRQHPAVTPDDG
jgi:3-oxoadipate enol-lactonase/4-carboxymuconolactone decarboxylase